MYHPGSFTTIYCKETMPPQLWCVFDTNSQQAVTVLNKGFKHLIFSAAVARCS